MYRKGVILMEIIMIEGTVISDEIKVLKTDNGVPLCRFTFSANSTNLNCLYNR